MVSELVYCIELFTLESMSIFKKTYPIYTYCMEIILLLSAQSIHLCIYVTGKYFQQGCFSFVEICKLKLEKLDFSCNRITVIPTVFRFLTTLTDLVLGNNPLQSPPAQV